ncbi:MAG: glycosyltransferase family 4 protein [Oscillospiraceae bacterium]|nr:glycosyltransferase family 4 protein [Oscillospiraceae bacterium]
MINKFLHANGGSETYMMCLGQYLSECGHTVEYFGMEHEKRCVGNSCECYTSNMDFHSGSIISKLSYPFRTIYSSEARKKLRIILEKFCPDAVHINNFNYQLTPSVILELVKWKKEGHKCRIVYTAHDCQLVCPNHMCRNPLTDVNCEKFLSHQKVKSEGLRLIYVGRLIRDKGVQGILSALSQIKNDKVTFTVVGDGDYGDELKHQANGVQSYSLMLLLQLSTE